VNSVNVKKRARSDEQKQHRRIAILVAAETHFVDAGFEKFSMAVVAKFVGVSKGTLYLYFETREEILLALCLDKLTSWASRLIAASKEWTSDRALIECFYDTFTTDKGLVRLMSRLDSVIEHNVSLDRLIEAKRAMAALLVSVSQTIAAILNLTQAQASEAVNALSSLLLGAIQVDLGPSYQESDFPEDVRQLISAFSSHDMFVTNGCRIVSGIRRDAAKPKEIQTQ
jgi:AcrR family transcriptional regulator